MEYASACPRDSEFVLVENLRKIHVQGRRGYDPTYKLVASYAAPINRDWLPEIAPQFRQPTPQNPSTLDVGDCIQEAIRSISPSANTASAASARKIPARV